MLYKEAKRIGKMYGVDIVNGNKASDNESSDNESSDNECVKLYLDKMKNTLKHAIYHEMKKYVNDTSSFNKIKNENTRKLNVYFMKYFPNSLSKDDKKKINENVNIFFNDSKLFIKSKFNSVLKEIHSFIDEHVEHNIKVEMDFIEKYKYMDEISEIIKKNMDDKINALRDELTENLKIDFEKLEEMVKNIKIEN